MALACAECFFLIGRALNQSGQYTSETIDGFLSVFGGNFCTDFILLNNQFYPKNIIAILRPVLENPAGVRDLWCTFLFRLYFCIGSALNCENGAKEVEDKERG